MPPHPGKSKKKTLQKKLIDPKIFVTRTIEKNFAITLGYLTSRLAKKSTKYHQTDSRYIAKKIKP